MAEIPLRAAPRPDGRHCVRWPGAPPNADPWEDSFWKARAEGGFADLFAAWEQRNATGDREPFLRVAESHGLLGPVLHDKNQPTWGFPAVELDTLVRVAADLWPAVGIEGPELVLGGASLFADRTRLRVAVAGCIFLWAHRRWPSVFTAWCRSKGRPPPEVREQVRAVGLAPWSLWRVEHRADGVHLYDHTGLGPDYQPTGPVEVRGEAPAGEGLAARVVRTDRGWVAHTALSVARLPDRAVLQEWIEDEMILARTFRPEIRIEPLLRRRAVLVRRVL